MGLIPVALLVIVGVALVGAVVVLALRAEKRRAAAIATLAQVQGWTHRRDADDLRDRYVGTPFGRGDRRRARNELHGTYRGQEVTAFEYSFTTTSSNGSNTSTTTHRFVLAGVALPREVPKLEVGREHVGTRLLGAVGMRDLQLESAEFNAAFRISTDDDRFAYDVLHPRTMEWMLVDPRLEDHPFRFERADLVTWTKGRMDPAQVLPLLDLLCDLRERVPPHAFDPR